MRTDPEEVTRGEAALAAYRKLAQAFRLLRKEGFFARQRFMCCNSCAGCAFCNEVEARIEQKKSVPKGAVYYSKQGGFFHMVGKGPRVRKLHLHFSGFNTSKFGRIGMPTVEIGNLVCKVLDKVGLAYEWDGSENSCIEIDPCPGMWGIPPATWMDRVSGPSIWDRV